MFYLMACICILFKIIFPKRVLATVSSQIVSFEFTRVRIALPAYKVAFRSLFESLSPLRLLK